MYEIKIHRFFYITLLFLAGLLNLVSINKLPTNFEVWNIREWASIVVYTVGWIVFWLIAIKETYTLIRIWIKANSKKEIQ